MAWRDVAWRRVAGRCDVRVEQTLLLILAPRSFQSGIRETEEQAKRARMRKMKGRRDQNGVGQEVKIGQLDCKWNKQAEREASLGAH